MNFTFGKIWTCWRLLPCYGCQFLNQISSLPDLYSKPEALPSHDQGAIVARSVTLPRHRNTASDQNPSLDRLRDAACHLPENGHDRITDDHVAAVPIVNQDSARNRNNARSCFSGRISNHSQQHANTTNDCRTETRRRQGCGYPVDPAPGSFRSP